MNIKTMFLASMTVLVAAIPFHSINASGVATLQGKDSRNSTMEIEYLDEHNVRMNMQRKKGDDSYMLVRDGKAYMVSSSGGQTMVMDMEQLGSMARNMGADTGGNDLFKQELVKYDNTGKSETVAGYTGEIYNMTWRDSKGTHTADAVLSSHQDVRDFHDAWMHMAEVMASAISRQGISDKSILHFMKREGKGALRVGDDFHVVSIETKDINADRFRLPAVPMQLPGIRGTGR